MGMCGSCGAPPALGAVARSQGIQRTYRANASRLKIKPFGAALVPLCAQPLGSAIVRSARDGQGETRVQSAIDAPNAAGRTRSPSAIVSGSPSSSATGCQAFRTERRTRCGGLSCQVASPWKTTSSSTPGFHAPSRDPRCQRAWAEGGREQAHELARVRVVAGERRPRRFVSRSPRGRFFYLFTQRAAGSKR